MKVTRFDFAFEKWSCQVRLQEDMCWSQSLSCLFCVGTRVDSDLGHPAISSANMARSMFRSVMEARSLM